MVFLSEGMGVESVTILLRKQNLSLINIQTAIRNGVDPGPVDDWKM